MYGYELHRLLDKIPQIVPYFKGITTIDKIKLLPRIGDFIIINTE